MHIVQGTYYLKRHKSSYNYFYTYYTQKYKNLLFICLSIFHIAKDRSYGMIFMSEDCYEARVLNKMLLPSLNISFPSENIIITTISRMLLLKTDYSGTAYYFKLRLYIVYVSS